MKNVIRILFFAANPMNTSKLRLDEEIRQISQKIRLSNERDNIRLESAWATRTDDIIQEINIHNPDIVHFIGHGDKEGNLIVVDNIGEIKKISPESLKFLFKSMGQNIKHVFLNLCYSEIQAKAIIENIDTVIGMRYPIGDETAIIFASSFYRALGFGKSIKEAYDQGLTAIILEGIDEQHTPILLHKDDVEPSKIFLFSSQDSGAKGIEIIDMGIANNSDFRIASENDELTISKIKKS